MKKVLIGVLVLTIVLMTPVFAGKVLHMITALDTNEAKIYIDAFEKDTGIQVQWVRLSAGEVLARVRAEAKRPTFSLWFGGPALEFIKAKQLGLLEPYKSPIAWGFPLTEKDPDGYWVGFYFGAIGFVSNKNKLKEIGAEPPRSWADLLKPVFKGRICMAYPYTSGTAYTTLTTILQLFGEKKGFEYAKKLNAQIKTYTNHGSAPVTLAGLGEVTVGIAFSHDIVKKGIAKGYPVVMTFPSEGTGYEIGGMALIKGGPEPELAKQFEDWMLSVKGQNLMQKWYRIPLNPKATVAKGSVKPSEVKLIKLDFLKAGNEYDRIIDKWKNEVLYGK